MKNRLLVYLLCFAFSLPLMFSCSATKEYYSFGPATGNFHGAKAEKNATKINTPEAENALVSIELEQEESSAPTASEMAVTASVNEQPVAELNSVEAKLKAATAEAEAQKSATAVYDNKAQKLNFVQKLALKKMQKMVKKATTAQGKGDSLKKPGLLEKIFALDQNLKYALIFLLVGLILYIIPGPIGWVLGTICVVIALIFLILWIASM